MLALTTGLAAVTSCSDSRPESFAGSVVSVSSVDDADSSDQWNVVVDFDGIVPELGSRANVWVDGQKLTCQEGVELPGGPASLATGQRVVVEWQRSPVGLSSPLTIWAERVLAECGE